MMDGEEEEAVSDEELAGQNKAQENRYKIFGTAKNPLFAKPSFVEDLFKVFI